MKLSRNVKLLLGWYLLGIGACSYFLLSGNFKSGPCTPGLDICSWFLFLIISAVLATVSLVKLFINRKNLLLLLINLSGILVAVVTVALLDSVW
ncbi:MAG: hypothetical protein EOP46_08410 [Sphingobacteriaceae bacterium]|nr:MAG: hypothetical protein EOP46_08410 [Sphingobacteriaceae bacterium]